MQYTLDGECLGTIESTDELTDGTGLGLNDAMGCIAMPLE